MQTAIHLTEFYEEVLGPSLANAVSLDFRTPDFEFTVEFAATPEGQFWAITEYDEAATDIAIGARLQTLAGYRDRMLVEHEDDEVVLQTTEREPRQLVEQTKEIADALDADRFAIVDVRLRATNDADLRDRLKGRLVSVGLLDWRDRPFQRV